MRITMFAMLCLGLCCQASATANLSLEGDDYLSAGIPVQLEMSVQNGGVPAVDQTVRVQLIGGGQFLNVNTSIGKMKKSRGVLREIELTTDEDGAVSCWVGIVPQDKSGGIKKDVPGGTIKVICQSLGATEEKTLYVLASLPKLESQKLNADLFRVVNPIGNNQLSGLMMLKVLVFDENHKPFNPAGLTARFTTSTDGILFFVAEDRDFVFVESGPAIGPCPQTYAKNWIKSWGEATSTEIIVEVRYKGQSLLTKTFPTIARP